MDYVRVFNNAPFTLCYRGEGLESYERQEIIIESKRWVAAPRGFAINRLSKNPHLLIDWGHPDPEQWKTLLPWPYLTLATPLDRWTGYGMVGEGFAHHMKGKVPFKLSAMGSWNPQSVESPIVRELMTAADNTITEWALCVTIPPELPRAPSPRRILYSMWETGVLPDCEAAGGNWAEITNSWTEGLIVPCESQKELWASAGVTVPIYVCPLGIAEEFKYHERLPRKEEDPFTILSYGVLTSRKSPIETIQAVWGALGDNEDWRLILKTRAGQLGAGAFMPKVEDPRIEVINEDYTGEEMAELCRRADLGLFLSKYEGFGLPPREMQATGLPVVWTEYSGHLDDCNPRYNVPIPITHVIDANEGYAGLGGWGVPNWDMAKIAIKAQYEDWKNRGRGQSKMGRLAAGWIRARCDWEGCTRKLLEIVKGVVYKE